MKRRMRQRDLARIAGVSAMTISLALRNHPSLPLETRQRLQRLAIKHQYTPDPHVTVLNQYRNNIRGTRSTTVLGYITHWPLVSHYTQWRKLPLYRPFFEAASQRAIELGYKLEEFDMTVQHLSIKRLNQILYHRNIRGVIIAPLPTAKGHLRLNWDSLCAVAHGYSLTWPELHRISCNQFRMVTYALHQLKRLGYRRPGFTYWDNAVRRTELLMLGGYLAGQQIFRADEQIPALNSVHPSEFIPWFKQHKPDVILTLSPGNIYESLKVLKIRIPEDVGLVDFDCPDRSGRMAGIYQNWEAQGKTAVDILVSLIQRNEVGVPSSPMISQISGEWIPGKTIRSS